MKTILPLFFLICTSLTMFSQISTKRYAGWVINEHFDKILNTSDGGVIGVNSGSTGGSQTVKKYSEAGLLQFTLPFAATTILPTSDGGYMMAINANSAQTSLTSFFGGYDLWIIKINSSGTISWQKSLSGTGDDYLQEMKLNSNGDLIAIVSSNSSDNFGTGNQGGKDLWLVHLSNNIGTQTKINLGGSADETFKNLENISATESLICLTTSSQNGVFNQGFKGGIDTWVLKITKGVSLSITQKRAYGGSSDDEGNLIISNQKYLITGYSKSNNGDLSINKGLKDIWICFTNTDGTLISSDNYGGTGDDVVKDAFYNTVDNAFYVLGDNTSIDGDFPNPSSGQTHGRLFKFSNLGTFGWRRDFYAINSGGYPTHQMVKVANESGVIISGSLDYTNLFYNLSPGGNFFCKLVSTDGSTNWYKTSPGFRGSTYLLEKQSDGRFLCGIYARTGYGGSSGIFTIDNQGLNPNDIYEYNCPINQQLCQPPYLSAISSINGATFVKYENFGLRKVCPKVYVGIPRIEKLYCNATINDTIQVPNDSEYNFQWKRNGTTISGATLPKYVATQVGKYTVEISGKTCIGKAETDTIVLALATNQIVIPTLTTTTDSTVCTGDTVKMTLTNGCNYSFLQWQKNGIDINGETSLNFNTTTGGIYRVKVTTSGIASYTNTKTVTINTNCCVMKSIANGSWESPSTWSCNRVPTITDNVTINGHQINVTTNTAVAKKVIYQGGKINMANSTSKLLIQTN